MALRPIRMLELCSGYGGLGLGVGLAVPGSRAVAHVEREAFAAAILVKEMEEGSLASAPVWDDLATFDGEPWRGLVDLVTAGFPCQPWSQAGSRGGADDERYHGVWPNIARIITECRAPAIFLENVSIDAFRGPRSDLEDLGYVVPPAVRVSASDVGAPHQRDRWFVLAYSDGARLEEWESKQSHDGEERETSKRGCRVGNTNHLRELQPQGGQQDDRRWSVDASWWSTEPNVGRVAHGVANRADRLHVIGNGVVPLAAATAFRVLADEQLTPVVSWGR